MRRSRRRTIVAAGLALSILAICHHCADADLNAPVTASIADETPTTSEASKADSPFPAPVYNVDSLADETAAGDLFFSPPEDLVVEAASSKVGSTATESKASPKADETDTSDSAIDAADASSKEVDDIADAVTDAFTKVPTVEAKSSEEDSVASTDEKTDEATKKDSSTTESKTSNDGSATVAVGMDTIKAESVDTPETPVDETLAKEAVVEDPEDSEISSDKDEEPETPENIPLKKAQVKEQSPAEDPSYIDLDGPVEKKPQNVATATEKADTSAKSATEVADEEDESKDPADTEVKESSATEEPADGSEDEVADDAEQDSVKKTTKESEPKAGSLASFFNQVNTDAGNPMAALTAATTMKGPDLTSSRTSTNIQGSTTSTTDSEEEELLDGEVPVPYCGVWGVFSGERQRADLSVLFLLFQDLFLADGETVGGKPVPSQMDMAEMASMMTDEIIRQGKQTMQEAPDVSETADAAAKKSVNDDFVEGLDDIDKLFEGVDPPDELDVGAGGSSMQDVLVGQGARILLKRVTMGAQHVRKTFVRVKDNVVLRVKNKDVKITLPEKEDVVQAAKWVWKSVKHIGQVARGVLDDMMEGDDLEGDLGNDDDMDQYMRQFRGSEEAR